MQAVNGYLEDGRFTPIEMMRLPRRVPAVLVFNEADAEETREGRPKRKPNQAHNQIAKEVDRAERERRALWLNRLHEAVDASLGEDLPDIPRSTHMNKPLDLAD